MLRLDYLGGGWSRGASDCAAVDLSHLANSKSALADVSKGLDTPELHKQFCVQNNWMSAVAWFVKTQPIQ